MICDVGTRRYRKLRRGAEITQCCLLGRYTYRKDTKIQKIQEYGHTEDTRTAGIAPSRFPPRRPVSMGGAASIRVRPMGICGYCVYRAIPTAGVPNKLYIQFIKRLDERKRR